MKLPDFDVANEAQKLREATREYLRRSCSQSNTAALEDMARACIDELRNRGAVLQIEGDRNHHADALRSVESLASSARTVELLLKGKPANDNAGE